MQTFSTLLLATGKKYKLESIEWDKIKWKKYQLAVPFFVLVEMILIFFFNKANKAMKFLV